MDLHALGGTIGPRLTVLQVLPALQGGGAELGALEVAAALVRGGHRSLVISAGGRFVGRLEAEGSRHIAWPIGVKSPLTLRHVRRLRRLLREEDVTILHARSRLPAWVAWLAWRGLPAGRRPRFITTVHGLYSVNAYSAVMTRGERVIAVSGAARDYVLAAYAQVAPERVSVIHRGVDTDRYSPGYRPSEQWLADWYRRYPQTRGKYLVTLPGRLTRRKGVLDFFGVMQGLRHQGIPAHGLLVGEAPAGRHARFMNELRRQLASDGLAASITLTGHREDLRDILANSGAVLSLARHPEAFGRTVAEALSLGRPVAGYDHGGVGEQLQALFPAGRVPVGDVAAVCARLAAWHAGAPRPAANQLYTLERMCTSTLDLYQELAAERSDSGVRARVESETVPPDRAPKS
jgi:glycosyltransferase involved in cell wall biosynthesis